MPSDLSVGQLIYVIRKRLNLSADKALFIFISNTRVLASRALSAACRAPDCPRPLTAPFPSASRRLPPTSMLMREVYAQHADAADGFLYVSYSGESTFGYC